MSPALAFQIISLAVAPWWVVWIAAPRSRVAARAASHGAVFVALGAAYAVLLFAAVATGSLSGVDFDALRAALSTPLGLLAGWTHYLAFDLFVGAWIVREARRIDVDPRPYLPFALALGPVGLGAFLVRRALRLRSMGQIGETDLL